jgi:hypothetical protein
MNSKQASLWLNGQFLNLYSHNTLPTESMLEMTQISTAYFQGNASKEDITNGRLRLMLEALVDEDDSEMLMSLSEEDINWAYTFWVLANG